MHPNHMQSFNSTLVRLKGDFVLRYRVVIDAFQFHTGSIKRRE